MLILLLSLIKLISFYLLNMSDNYYINEKLKKIIEKTVKSVFPKLQESDIEILSVYTKTLVKYISKTYFFDNKDDKYEKQWLQNDCRDIKSVLLLLLPYINDKDDSLLLKNLTNLKDIYLPDKIYEDTNDFNNKEILRLELGLKYVSNVIHI